MCARHVNNSLRRPDPAHMIIAAEHDSKHSKPLPRNPTMMVIYEILITSAGLTAPALILLVLRYPGPSLDLQWLRLPTSLTQCTEEPKSIRSSFRTLESDSSFEHLWFWFVRVCSNMLLWGGMTAHSHVDYSLLCFPESQRL
jgi:hypothetical protein